MFWLTLVDFLVQIIFFGLFMGVIYLVIGANGAAEKVPVVREISETPSEDATTTYARDSGYPGAAELTDELSRLVPASGFQRFKKAVEDAGGSDAVVERLRSANRHDEKLKGLGRPPCLTGQDGIGYRSIAHVRAYDDRIEFLNDTEDLEEALKDLGVTYDQVRVLSLDEFRQRFSRLHVVRPECVHYLDVEEHYASIGTRDAIEGAFILGKRTRPK